MFETYPLSTFERVIIVDNFYQNPDAIRNFALQVEKEKQSSGNYAGVMTEQSFLTQEHLDIFSTLAGHKVIPSTSFTGKFRFTKIGDSYKQDIHFDPEAYAWACVCYLTPTEYPEGTIFWKHNRTGLESIPRTLEGLQQYGWSGPDDLKEFLETEGVNHSLWTKTMVVPYRYNRLVMFRPWRFHSPGPAFGTDFETARLIQTFFLGIGE